MTPRKSALLLAVCLFGSAVLTERRIATAAFQLNGGTNAATANDLATRPLSPAIVSELAQGDNRTPIRNPFRLSGKLSTPAQMTRLARTPERGLPSIVVLAIVGGPPWTAALALEAGAHSRVVAPGDTFAAARVLRIAHDSVLFALQDTLWAVLLPRRVP